MYIYKNALIVSNIYTKLKHPIPPMAEIRKETVFLFSFMVNLFILNLNLSIICKIMFVSISDRALVPFYNPSCQRFCKYKRDG